MKTITTSVCMAGVFVISGFAYAGVPAWCKDHEYSGSPSLSGLQSKDPKEVIETVAEAICNPDQETQTNRVAIDTARAAWSKKLQMKDTDWADVVAYSKRDGVPTVTDVSTKDLSKFSAMDQYFFIRSQLSTDWMDFAYNADMFDSRLTESGRLGYVQACMNVNVPAVWAICAPDVAKVDANKILAEISADGNYTGGTKMQLRYAVLDLKTELVQHDIKVKTALKKDAAYQRMFEVAAKARTEWTQMMSTSQALLDDVFKAETGYFSKSRSLQAGCESKTTTMLAEQVANIPAKSFDKMIDERRGPNGFGNQAGLILAEHPQVNLAATAYALCNADGISTYLAAYLQQTPGYRGPRSLAHTRLLSEKIQLDDTSARLEWPTMKRPYARGYGNISSYGGVIAKATQSGDTVMVTLQKMTVKRDECVASHNTKKIYKIQGDGSVQYESICDRRGMVTYNEQWADFTVNKKYAALLKKGVRISAINPINNAETGAEVIAVWADGKATKPMIVMGGKLK
jgi:hypothetical protein